LFVKKYGMAFLRKHWISCGNYYSAYHSGLLGGSEESFRTKCLTENYSPGVPYSKTGHNVV